MGGNPSKNLAKIRYPPHCELPHEIYFVINSLVANKKFDTADPFGGLAIERIRVGTSKSRYLTCINLHNLVYCIIVKQTWPQMQCYDGKDDDDDEDEDDDDDDDDDEDDDDDRNEDGE